MNQDVNTQASRYITSGEVKTNKMSNRYFVGKGDENKATSKMNILLIIFVKVTR